MEEALSQISLCRQNHTQDLSLVAGDFNAKRPLWGCRTEDDRGTLLNNFAAANWLLPINDPSAGPTSFTHNGQGWPDVTLASYHLAHLVNHWVVQDVDTASDHQYITFDISATEDPIKVRRRFRSKFGGHARFAAKLEEALPHLYQLLSNVRSKSELDYATAEITSAIVSASHRAYGTRIPKGTSSATWWTPALRAEQNKIKALRRRLAKSTDSNSKLTLKAEIRKHRALYKRHLRQTRQESWRNFCTATQSKFGIEFKVGFGKYTREEMLSNNSRDPAANFTTQRDDIIRELFPTCNASLPPLVDTNKAEVDHPFTNGELRHAVKTIRAKKAPGPDNIDGYIIKALYSYHPSLLLSLFNACLTWNHFPACFKVADVVLFAKKRTQDSAAQRFRPICLLPVMGKILEKLLIHRIHHYLDTSSTPLDRRQHGFMKGRSTETAIKQLLDKQKEWHQLGMHVTMISFDIQGAFDNVQWPIIIQALRRKNLPGYIINSVHSYLSNRKILLTNGAPWNTSKGCPQGSCFGPILWNLVADSVFQLDWPANAHIQAYADDFVLLIGGHSRLKLEITAESAINTFANWTASNQLNISVDKTSSLTFGKLERRYPTLRLNNRPIPHVKTLVYLGVTIDEKLTWLPHIARMKTRALAASRMATWMSAKTWGVSAKLLRVWYHSVTERILLYACPVWFPDIKINGKMALKSCQRNYLLQITRAARNVSTDALNVIANVYPINLLADKLSRQGSQLRLCPDPIFVAHSADHKVHPALEDLDNIFCPPADNPEILIYTDGSRIRDQVGGAFVIYRHDQLLDSHKFKLRQANSVFQAELHAIYKAASWASSHGLNAWIQSDSASAIQALQQTRNPDAYVQDIKALLRATKSSINITWTRAHVGTIGNEEADKAAKNAALSSDIPTTTIAFPHTFLRRTLKKTLLQNWQSEWELSENGRDLFPFIPNVIKARIITDRRLAAFFTGHGPFPAILYRLNLIDTPLCACGIPGTPMHYLTECELTSSYHVCKSHSVSYDQWLLKLYTDYYAQKAIIRLVNFLQDNELTLRFTEP